jgi:hypothetical protein
MNRSRTLPLLVALAVGLASRASACAEASPPDAAVVDRTPAAARLVATLGFELPYGADPGTLGFSPPGNEREALGPNAIEVRSDGTILLSDPVRRKVFAVRLDAAGRPSLAVAGALPPRPRAGSGGVPTRTRTVKTSGEHAEIVFADGAARRRVAVSAGGPLASLRLVGVDRSGRAFVVLERFRAPGRLEVDRELLVVEAEGGLVARAPLPAAPLVSPLTEFWLTPEGVLWRLAAGADAVHVERLEVRP